MNRPAVVCDRNNYFFCGDTTPYISRTVYDGNIQQNLSEYHTNSLGVVSKSRTRSFSLTYNQNKAYANGTFGVWTPSPVGAFQACGQPAIDITGSVSENYQYTSTVFYFLDTRYNNALYKRTIENVTFSEPANLATYLLQGNRYYCAKYVIKNHVVTTNTQYCIMLNGAEAILATVENTNTIHGSDNPLILVYPMPPKDARFEDSDIEKYDFYDYQNVGDQAGRKAEDGGDDYFFTEWMRGVGLAFREEDQKQADDRYLWFYLGSGDDPPTPSNRTYDSASVPDLKTSTLPIGSIAVDYEGNKFYSTCFPKEETVSNNVYYRKSALVINGSEVTIPMEDKMDYNAWYPIAPV